MNDLTEYTCFYLDESFGKTLRLKLVQRLPRQAATKSSSSQLLAPNSA